MRHPEDFLRIPRGRFESPRRLLEVEACPGRVFSVGQGVSPLFVGFHPVFLTVFGSEEPLRTPRGHPQAQEFHPEDDRTKVPVLQKVFGSEEPLRTPRISLRTPRGPEVHPEDELTEESGVFMRRAHRTVVDPEQTQIEILNHALKQAIVKELKQ
ncbi:MAG: hypothetical protein V1915_01980 [Candidatus Bathyarchaeota archaeon]